MGNSDLLFIFVLCEGWKWKTVVKGQEYMRRCEALIIATQRLVAHWDAHNEEAMKEAHLPEEQRGRIWVDYSPDSVQIEEL